jgi:hypothetical protein
MQKDIYYENQRIYCENNKLPFFASRSCNHSYGWNRDRDNYGKLQTLREILVERYGIDDALELSSTSHIISCPGCSRSWCD